MMRAPDSTTIEEIMAATGCKANTVRCAMAWALKKKIGLEVISEKVESCGRDLSASGSLIAHTRNLAAALLGGGFRSNVYNRHFTWERRSTGNSRTCSLP